MTRTRRSARLLAGISILAIGLMASPLVIDGHPLYVGNNLALAQGGGGGGAGGGGGHGGSGGPGAGPGAGGQGAHRGMEQGMEMQEGFMSQGGMTQGMPGQAMSRETIGSVQRRLNQLGYAAGPEDGVMGPRTRRAISAYQAQMGMKPDGMLTPDVVEHMMTGSPGGYAN